MADKLRRAEQRSGQTRRSGGRVLHGPRNELAAFASSGTEPASTTTRDRQLPADKRSKAAQSAKRCG